MFVRCGSDLRSQSQWAQFWFVPAAARFLKPTAAYPGDLADDSQMDPAQRLKGRSVSQRGVRCTEEFAVWVLPPDTLTRALRFTHVTAPTESTYHGWLGARSCSSGRMINVGSERRRHHRQTATTRGRK